jgi:hypothetical protein
MFCGWRNIPNDILLKENKHIYFLLDFPDFYENIEISIFWIPKHVHNKICLEYAYLYENKLYGKDIIYNGYKVNDKSTIITNFKIKKLNFQTIIFKLNNVNIVRMSCSFRYEKK